MGYQVIPIDKLRGKTITVSFKRYSEVDDTNTSTCAIIQAADEVLVDEYTYKSTSLLNSKLYKELRFSKDATDGYFTCTFTIPEDETRKNLFIAFYIGISAIALENQVVEYTDIQVEVGSAATSYTPYKDAGVKVYGKNLLDVSNPYGETAGSTTTITGETATLVRGATGNAPSIIWAIDSLEKFVGKKLTSSLMLLISSTLLFEAASISTTSVIEPERIPLQISHSLQGSPSFGFKQLIALASILAEDVFPVPLPPFNR